MMRLLLALAIGAAAPLLQYKANVDVVRLEALVLGENGRPVAGLTAADFVVADNGTAQTVRVRALAREPIDVAIALDVSGSVAGIRLERLRAGALALVGALSSADRATLLTFDHALRLGPRDAAPAALDRRLRELSAEGRTSLVDAATTALVWGMGRDRPMLVIVFSDGRDTGSWTRPEQALALAARSGAVVDAVVMGERLPAGGARFTGHGHAALATPNERFAADLAVSTGGRVRNGSAGAGLAGAFREALQQFRARYEITYDVTSQTPGWHALDVRVPHRRGAAVHVRRGYQR